MKNKDKIKIILTFSFLLSGWLILIVEKSKFSIICFVISIIIALSFKFKLKNIKFIKNYSNKA